MPNTEILLRNKITTLHTSITFCRLIIFYYVSRLFKVMRPCSTFRLQPVYSLIRFFIKIQESKYLATDIGVRSSKPRREIKNMSTGLKWTVWHILSCNAGRGSYLLLFYCIHPVESI